MNNFIKIIKIRWLDFLIILISSVLLLFILKKMPYALTSSIINLILSLLILTAINKIDTEEYKKISAYEFFSSLLSAINRNLSFKNSFDISNKYLLSYHEILQYDSFLEINEFKYLGEYETNLLQVIDDEKHNQVHLSNYNLLINRLENDIQDKKKKNDKFNHLLTFSSSLIILFFLALVILRFTIFVNTTYTSLATDIILTLFSFIVPINFFINYLLRRN